MGNEVIAKTTCDVCGEIVERPGAEANLVPEGWVMGYICPKHIPKPRKPRKPRKDKGTHKGEPSLKLIKALDTLENMGVSPLDKAKKPRRNHRSGQVDPSPPPGESSIGKPECAGCKEKGGCKLTEVAAMVDCWTKKLDNKEIQDNG